MEHVLENIVPQAGFLNGEENPTIDSDRVKAPVDGASFTDFGRSQKHDVANQAGAEGVNRLAPTASQKTSEKRRQIHANYNINSYLLKTQEIKVSEEEEQTSVVFLSLNEWHTKQWNKEFTSLKQQIESLMKRFCIHQ